MSKISFILLLLISLNGIAQTIKRQLEIPNSSVVSGSSGKTLIRVVVPGSPPPEIYTEKSASITSNAVMISDVPALDWCYGCTPTSGAMLAGYYDRNGYDNIYTGSTNSGVFPLTNEDWGSEECPLSASHMGIDGRTTYGHVDDYYRAYDDTIEPYEEAGRTPHSDDCIADYMKTSQWNYGNSDGSTTLYFWTDGSPYQSTGEDPYVDGGYGLQLFMESKGYTVVNRYNQYIDSYVSGGFSFDDYKTEIDNNRPVLIHLAGHTMLGIGYDDDTEKIYVYNTWDYSTHEMTWGGTYYNMKHYGVTVLELENSGTTVSVTITNNTYTYNGTARSVTVTTSPSGLAHTITYYDQSNNKVASPTNVGSYNVKVNITESGYESEGPFYGTLTINKKTLTATADNQSVDYGDPEPDYPITYSGFVTGEGTADLTVVPIAGILETWPAEPGTHTIYVGSGTDENYSFSYNTGTLTVNALSINDIVITNDQYTYDGTSKSITVTTDPSDVNYDIEYKLDGENISNPTNAGTYTVTITINETGYNANQYVSTLTIDQAELTAAADDQSTAFGNSEPEYTINYSGFVTGEVESVLDEAPTADVEGTWPLVPGSYPIEVSNGYDNNYTITSVNGTLTVTPAQVDSLNFTDLFYTYDGLPHEATILPYPDSVRYNVTYTDSNSLQVIQPLDAGNYLVRVIITESCYQQDTFYQSLTIKKSLLTVVVQDEIIAYNDSLPDFSYTISGFVNNEDESAISVMPSLSLDNELPLLPGNYTIKASGGEASNYNFTYQQGTLTVTPLMVQSITVNDTITVYTGTEQQVDVTIIPAGIGFSINYYDENDQSVTVPVNAGYYSYQISITETGYAEQTVNGQFEIMPASLFVSIDTIIVTYGDSAPEPLISYSGFVNGESINVLNEQPSADSITDWPWQTGTYGLTVSGGFASNYTFKYTEGELTVQPATLSVIPDNFTITYNDSLPDFTYTLSGFAFDENESVLTSLPKVHPQETTPVLPGDYLLIASGGEAVNYTFTYQTGTLKIEPISNATISVVNLDTTYTGTLHEVHAKTDPDGLDYSIEYKGTPVTSGTYPVYATLSQTGYLSITDTGYINIEKAPLNISVKDTSILLGRSISEYDIIYNGFVNNENIDSIDILPTADAGEEYQLEAGTYPIILSGGSDDNYDLQYNNGTLTIVQTYWIKVGAGENGMIKTGENGEPFNEVSFEAIINEDSPDFYAIPNDGYLFSMWDNGDTQNPISFLNITKNIAVNALFEAEVGTKKFKNDLSFKLYPNPVNAMHPFELTVELPDGPQQNSRLLIYDITGKIISEKTNIGENVKFSGLKAGVYMVYVSAGEKVKTFKLMIR